MQDNESRRVGDTSGRRRAAPSRHSCRGVNGIGGRGLPLNGQLLEVAMPGPAPKPASKRRRYGKPKSYGDAEPTTAPAARSGDPSTRHRQSASADHGDVGHRADTPVSPRSTATTDWERLRMELWYANHTMASGRPSAQAWDAIQHGLSELLISPAVKRRSRHRAAAVAVGCGCGCRGVDDRPVSAEPEAGLIPLKNRYGPKRIDHPYVRRHARRHRYTLSTPAFAAASQG